MRLKATNKRSTPLLNKERKESRTVLLYKVFGLLLLFALVVGCQTEDAQGNNEAPAEGNDTADEQQENETAQETAEATEADDDGQSGNVAQEAGENMILATTTSTEDSGLLDALVPMFEEESGFNVQIIAVGTGQALAMGEQGEADALLTHAPDAEEELEAEGAVLNRQRVMYNDFVVLGPEDDLAQIDGAELEEGFQTLHDEGATFISRGDDSGTHKKELEIWELIDSDPQENEGYTETGQGMGDTLRVASEREGYVLTDRGTYLAQQDLVDNLHIVIEGDETLHNIYHVMQVDPNRSDLINESAAEQFVDFMISDEVQDVIETFGVEEYAEPLFFPDAQ